MKPSQSRFKIIIPARGTLRTASAAPSKRKPAQDDMGTEGEPKPKSKKAKKERGNSPADSLDDNIQTAPKKRAPGRPRKSKRPSFVVPCYVLVPQHPLVILGKTIKGNKSHKQPPETVGPFDLTPKTTWKDFIRGIRKAAGLGKNRVKVMCAGMKWGMKKAGTLPLSDIRGYMTMLQQITARKDVDSLMVFVTLPPSCTPSKGHREGEKENTNGDEGRNARSDHDDTIYGQKVSTHLQGADSILLIFSPFDSSPLTINSSRLSRN